MRACGAQGVVEAGEMRSDLLDVKGCNGFPKEVL